MKPRRNFDEEALAWDEHPGRVRIMGEIADALFSDIALKPDMDVLDFGCGTGLVSLRIAGDVASLTGVDTSESMLEVFQRKAQNLKLENVRGLRVDLDLGGEIPGRYDLVVSSMVLHHIEHIPEVLARLYAALKPGGRIRLADLDLDGGRFHEDPTGVFHEGFDRAEVLRMMEQAGFSGLRIGLAAEIVRPGADGVEQHFTTFVASGQRSG